MIIFRNRSLLTYLLPNVSLARKQIYTLGLFRKDKTGIIAKFHRTDLVNCSHYSEGKTLSYSQINTN